MREHKQSTHAPAAAMKSKMLCPIQKELYYKDMSVRYQCQLRHIMVTNAIRVRRTVLRLIRS